MSTDQAKPAEVPVVAYECTEGVEQSEYLRYHPLAQGEYNGTAVALVRQSAHLAAMEALRQELTEAQRLRDVFKQSDAAVRDILSSVREQAEALRQQVAALEALSVKHIMIAVVPGEDGMGEEVYAESVSDVVNTLSELDGHAEDAASLRAEVAARDARIAELLAQVQYWRVEAWRPREQPSAIPVGSSLVHPDDAARASAAIGPGFEPMR